MSEAAEDRVGRPGGTLDGTGQGAPLPRRVAQRQERFRREHDAAVVTCRSVTISRESGARGGTIGRAVAAKLDWQVYDQEMIEYLASDPADRAGLLDAVDGPAEPWAGDWLASLLQAPTMDADSFIVKMAHVVLTIGLQGDAVIVGRGANFVLPRNRALSVRVIAPLSERVAYLVHRERLSHREAERRVRDTDERRSGFVHTYYHRDIAAPHYYDLVVDSSAFGEDVTADLIVQGLQAKVARLRDRLKPGRPR